MHVIAYRPVTLNQDIVTRTSGLSNLNSGWRGQESNREGFTDPHVIRDKVNEVLKKNKLGLS